MSNQKEEKQQGETSQSQYDQAFGQIASQVGNFGPEATREAWQAYFDLADQTLRTARRVGEMQVLALMHQQIVREVANQVITTIKQNPTLISSQQS